MQTAGRSTRPQTAARSTRPARAPRGVFASGSAAVAAAVALPLRRPFIDREPAPRRAPRPVPAPGPAKTAKPSRGILRGIGAFVVALPDHPWLDRVVRGRAWIPLLGVLLAGIVAAQVEILKLGASMGRSLEQTTTLTTQNEQLRYSVASLSDDQRIERLATSMGMVLPPPGSVGYLIASERSDVTRALGNIHAPDATAFMALAPTDGALVTGPGTSMLPTPPGVLAQAGTPGSATPTSTPSPTSTVPSSALASTGDTGTTTGTTSGATTGTTSGTPTDTTSASGADDGAADPDGLADLDHRHPGSDDDPAAPHGRHAERLTGAGDGCGCDPACRRHAAEQRGLAPDGRHRPAHRDPVHRLRRAPRARARPGGLPGLGPGGIAGARGGHAAGEQPRRPGAARDRSPTATEPSSRSASRPTTSSPIRILIKNPVSASAELASLLGTPQLTVLKLLTKPHTGFVYLAHLLPAAQATAISNLQIAGITLVPQTRRVYPRGDEAAQVVGSVHLDGDGASGIEFQYDHALQGTNGQRRIVSDARGQPISIDDLRPTVPGKTVALTIDSGLQQEVERVLAEVGAEYSPHGATAIAIDPSTGAILALANWPASRERQPRRPPRTRPIGLNYEPGSTFKAITVAGALQDGLVTPNTAVRHPARPPVRRPADPRRRVPRLRDAERRPSILKVSSNIGADLIGMKLGAKRFDYWVHRFGFGQPTGVDLPGEQSGIVLHWWQYSGSSMANLPFGQGESVTPMQMVAAYSAIANGGILRAPHVVQSVGGKPTALPPGRQIISATTASELRDMLRGVFADGGTASGAAIDGYDMAGKTGTANIAVDGHYSDSAYVASFIGMVPTDHPRLVVAVVVNQPHGSIFGGSVAAPAFQQIVGLGCAVPRDPAALADDAPGSCARSRSRPALGGQSPRAAPVTRAWPGVDVAELAPEHRESLVPLGADLGHPPDRIRQRLRRELVADLASGRACGRAGRRRSARSGA